MYAWSKRTTAVPAWSSSRPRRSASSTRLMPVACTPGTLIGGFRVGASLEYSLRMTRLALTGVALSIAAAFVLACGAGSAAAKDPAWTPYDRPAKYGVVEQTNVPITMSDGVQLNALVHRP